MLSGVGRVGSLFTLSPAPENNLSDGTDVYGMHKSCLANLIHKGFLPVNGIYIQRRKVVTERVFTSLSALLDLFQKDWYPSLNPVQICHVCYLLSNNSPN